MIKANITVRHSVVVVTVISVLGLTWFGTALAMPEHSKRFKLSCNYCHSKIPFLNEFGAFFLKDNPTLPAMKLPETVGGDMFSQSDEELSGNKDNGKPSMATENSVYANTSGSKSIPQVNPPAPTQVYRRVAKDGVQIFTDNPSKHTMPQILKKPDTGTIKSVTARKEKRPDKKPTVQRPIPVKRQDITVQALVSAVRYRSHEDCMEKVLLSQQKPANADEAMRFFVEAEETCRQFSNAP